MAAAARSCKWSAAPLLLLAIKKNQLSAFNFQLSTFSDVRAVLVLCWCHVTSSLSMTLNIDTMIETKVTVRIATKMLP